MRCAIALLSTVAQVDLERLALTAADLHLAAAEFAVHGGGERVLRNQIRLAPVVAEA